MNTEQWYDRLYKQPTCSCSSPERIWAIWSSKTLSLKSKTLQTHLMVKYSPAVLIHISGLPSCTLYLKLEQELATACTSCVLTTPRTWTCDWGVREPDYTWIEQLTSRCWSLLIFWRDWDNISISCKWYLFVFAPRSKQHLPPPQTHKGDRHGKSNRAIPELKISSYILKGGKVARTWLSLLSKKMSCWWLWQTNKHATHSYETWPFNLVSFCVSLCRVIS